MSDKNFENALEKAMQLLSGRAHSSRELSLKLKQRKFPSAVVDQVIFECERLNLLNDQEFAAIYVEELKSRGYGSRRIKGALFKKGIEGELVDELLRERIDFDEELQRAVAAMKRKLKSLQRESDPRKRREKLYRFLVGKGFAAEVIRRAIDQETEDRID